MAPPTAPPTDVAEAHPARVPHGEVAARAAQPSGPRARSIERRPFPAERRLVLAAERAGRRMMPMHGLLELDVTEARRLLAAHDPPLSFTAFLISSVARAAAAHPEVHAYRDWRGRIVGILDHSRCGKRTHGQLLPGVRNRRSRQSWGSTRAVQLSYHDSC